MTATEWPAPTGPTERVPLTWGKYVLIFIGVFAVALMIAAAVVGGDDASVNSGGDFYAAPGWTIQRAADLSIDLERDGGMSDAAATCTMKAIVGTTTWLEWRALSNAGQLRLIRTASDDC